MANPSQSPLSTGSTLTDSWAKVSAGQTVESLESVASDAQPIGRMVLGQAGSGPNAQLGDLGPMHSWETIPLRSGGVGAAEEVGQMEPGQMEIGGSYISKRKNR